MRQRSRTQQAQTAVPSSGVETTKAAAALASVFAELNEELSSIVQPQTDAVCPSCENVCCIDRFGRYDPTDLFSMFSRQASLPPRCPDREERDPCRFLGPVGCRLSRSDRPHRCNWFFCEALLGHMTRTMSARDYRTFINLLQRISLTRTSLAALAAHPEEGRGHDGIPPK